MIMLTGCRRWCVPPPRNFASCEYRVFFSGEAEPMVVYTSARGKPGKDNPWIRVLVPRGMWYHAFIGSDRMAKVGPHVGLCTCVVVVYDEADDD